MSWSKIDDKLHGHPKVAQASLEAMGLWTLALSWCAAYLTDGAIPAAQVQRLGGNDALAQELVSVGLWEETEGGYQIHDYHDYNPSAEKVRLTRAARAEAGRRGGERSKPPEQPEPTEEEANGKQTESKRKAKEEAKPNPVPDPVPQDTPNGADAALSQSASRLMFGALARLCQIDWRITPETGANGKGALRQSESELRKVGADPPELGVKATDEGTFAAWWYTHDWRGQKGDIPTPAQVREAWKKFQVWKQNGTYSELDAIPEA